MPQLDVYSFFAAATSVIILFLILLFMLHCYFLPKLARTLKLRNKYFLLGDKRVINNMNQKPNQKQPNVKGITQKILQGSDMGKLHDVKTRTQANIRGLGLKMFRYASPKLDEGIHAK